MTSAFLQTVCIAGLSAFVFGLTLRGDFVFDDSEAIVKNTDVVGSGPLTHLFIHDFWGSNITSIHSHKSYRPLTIYTYRINYLINGNALDAFQFKLVNLLCHILCSILVWRTYCILVREKESWTDVQFLSALLFAVHPVHVEAVSGVVGRADLLAGIFYFLSFLTYLNATRTKTTFLKYIYLAMNFIFSALSMVSKEIGVTVLGVCLSYEITYIRKLDVIKYLKGKCTGFANKKSDQESKTHSDSIVRMLVLVIAAVVLLAFRWSVMGNSKPTFQETDNPAAFSEHFFTRVLTYHYIYFLNILLLIWPQWLCFDWSMGCVPLVESPFDPRVLCVVVLYVYIIKSLNLLVKPKFDFKQKRLLIMAYTMTVIPFLPASNVLFAVGFVIAERLLYIPSAGFCLLVVVGLTKLTRRDSTHYWKIFYAFYFLLLLSFCLKTWKRSHDWQNEHDLFSSGLQVCPDNAKVHYNVAKAADARHQTERAIYEYKEAIRLYPKYYQAMNNLANLLKDQKKFREAENYLREAIKLKQDFAAAWMNLAIVLANTKRRQESRDAYLTALTHRHNYPDCYYNLGNLYLEMELNDHAEESWRNAISLNPKHRLAWSNLLALLDNTGQTQRALNIIPNALAELPEAYSIHFIVANILGKVGQFHQAEKHFLKAIEISGKNVQAIYYANLGVLYHRWKKYLKAEENYQKALAINPTLKSALNNIATVRNLITKQNRKRIGYGNDLGIPLVN